MLEKVRAKTQAECGISRPVHHRQPHASRASTGSTARRSQSLCRSGGQGQSPTSCCRPRGHGAGDDRHRTRRRQTLPTTGATSCPTAAWPCNGAMPSTSRPSPIDREYQVIRLDRADGTPLAVLFHYACHPVVHGRRQLPVQRRFRRHGLRHGRTAACTPSVCSCKAPAATSIHTWTRRRSTKAVSTKLAKWAATWASCWSRRPKQLPQRAPANPSLQFSRPTVPIRTRWDFDDPDVQSVLNKAYGPRFEHYIEQAHQEQHRAAAH